LPLILTPTSAAPECDKRRRVPVGGSSGIGRRYSKHGCEERGRGCGFGGSDVPRAGEEEERAATDGHWGVKVDIR